MTRRKILALGAVATLALGGWLLATHSTAAEEAHPLPAPAVDEQAAAATETAVVAGGCFWGVQGVFQHVRGVTNAVSGYSEIGRASCRERV